MQDGAGRPTVEMHPATKALRSSRDEEVRLAVAICVRYACNVNAEAANCILRGDVSPWRSIWAGRLSDSRLVPMLAVETSWHC